MSFRLSLLSLLSRDRPRLHALQAVRTVDLPDCWIGAGFIRDAIWDHLHGFSATPPTGDVDVVWFCREEQSAEADREIEKRLGSLAPGFDWSVKNQSRMHDRNGDAPYTSVADAMCRWPETATAVATRLTHDDRIEVNAPFGLDDLFGLRLAPTPAFAGPRKSVFDERVASKSWLERYPYLRMV